MFFFNGIIWRPRYFQPKSIKIGPFFIKLCVGKVHFKTINYCFWTYISMTMGDFIKFSIARIFYFIIDTASCFYLFLQWKWKRIPLYVEKISENPVSSLFFFFQTDLKKTISVTHSFFKAIYISLYIPVISSTYTS